VGDEMGDEHRVGRAQVGRYARAIEPRGQRQRDLNKAHRRGVGALGRCSVGRQVHHRVGLIRGVSERRKRSLGVGEGLHLPGLRQVLRRFRLRLEDDHERGIIDDEIRNTTCRRKLLFGYYRLFQGCAGDEC
jgi:hypothetical protein